MGSFSDDSAKYPIELTSACQTTTIQNDLTTKVVIHLCNACN